MFDLKQIKIEVPAPVREILGRLREGGFEAYIVGGCVRDALLGAEPKDFDITTSALPEQVKSLFSNTADTGIQHGTVMVILKGTGYEVTTFRIDGEYLDGRHPESVVFTRSLKEDLKRRDFTINAFAYDPESGVVDYFEGIRDLKEKRIRCVGDPDARFGEDALRIMRAVRFSASLDFEIEEKTREAILRHTQNLKNVSIERIREEFEKTLLSSHPEKVNLYSEMGMAGYLMGDPSLALKCFDPAFSGLYREAEGTNEEIRILRLAFFFGNLSSEETRLILRKMKYDNKTIRLVSGIIQNKDRIIPADRKTIRRLLNQIGVELFDLTVAYQAALTRTFEAEPEREVQLSRFSEIKDIRKEILRDGDPFRLSQLAVNGNDLILAGFEKGTKIGDILNSLLEAVLEDPSLNRKDKLLELAEQKR